MDFSIYYQTTTAVDARQQQQVCDAAVELAAGRSWLSCEPPFIFYNEQGRLCGASKPNFQPHADDVTAATQEGLPDGTVTDLLDIL